MTQEEKAKRYDEVFNAAKEWYNNPNSSSIGKSYLYAVFSELKESEDEKIRKELIAFLRSYDTFLTQRFIDWLEKQGEQKLNGTFVNVDDVREDFIDEVYRVLDSDPTNDRANQIIDAFDNLPTITIKQDPCEHCQMTPLNCYSFPCDEKREFEQGKSALEAINEEKVDNANKVEPKFKVDWIVGNKDNSVSHESDYHLWSIKDAKDGDVLQLGKVTAIFQNYISNKECRCYCSVFDGEFKIPVQYADTYGCHNAVPATKEQRDILMKAMAGAGYTFDFEKKELKKIDNETEIPFGAKDSELQEDTYYIPKGFHVEIDGDKVVIKKGEKPTTWSEEDEGILDEIIDFLENGTVKLQHDLSLYASWLKSLKDRVGCEVNCTTTKEWKPSKEQMAVLNEVINYAANSELQHWSNFIYTLLKSLREQLKKLK